MKIKLLFLLLFPIYGFCQSTSIEVKHLYMMPTFNYITIDSISNHDTLIDVNIAFKVTNLSDADSVFLNIGTTNGGSQTVSKNYNVSFSQGKYSLIDGTNSLQFHGENVYLKYVVSVSDLNDYSFIEVWGRDVSGNMTPKVKFQK